MPRSAKAQVICLVIATLSLFSAGPGAGCAAGVSSGSEVSGGARKAIGEELIGLWHAKLRFGPDIKGELTVALTAASGTAEVSGRKAPVHVQDSLVSFDLPGAEGSFKGWMRDGRILGNWIQPRAVSAGVRYASPVTLEKFGPGRWRGLVEPLDDTMTFFLSVTRNADGTLGAFLGNPERNASVFFGFEHIALDRAKVKLLGRRSKDVPEKVILEGTWDAENESITLPIPWGGGTFDFRRASPSEEVVFYPRGKTPAPYTYSPPADENDGWPVASLGDVGISEAMIKRFVQLLIDTPIDSVHAPEIHGVLIARHGKLVLEEYFHGFHRTALHDTRSAAKSLTSVLTGAAILQGEPVSLTTPVYETMLVPTPPGLDPRKKSITVENLLTMSSGLDCDDSDPASVGNEDVMQEQTAQPDWYRYTLDLKMVRAPGEKAVYGSANPNLLGGVLARKTGRWLPDLFRDLLAEPLGIRHYAMNLTPTGDAYMGGGVRIRPRDFMKVGQMMLDGGRWRGRQVVSKEWAGRSTSPIYELRGIHYGYLWWVIEYTYEGRTIGAFFAGGNGGQIVMGIPDLDLVIAFYGGNYSDPATYIPQRVYVPNDILPAVK